MEQEDFYVKKEAVEEEKEGWFSEVCRIAADLFFLNRNAMWKTEGDYPYIELILPIVPWTSLDFSSEKERIHRGRIRIALITCAWK